MKPSVGLARPVAAALFGAATLAGCSAAPGTSSSTTTTAATQSSTGSSSPTAGASTSSSVTSPATTSSASPSPAAALTLRNKRISVAEFGHTITVLAIQRNWPWPEGYEASSATLELVAVKMTWVAGSKYTAAISPDQFALVTGATLNRPDTTINALLTTRKYPLLPAKVLTGKKATGWLVFKVDPKGAKALVLRYDRPKALVTTTNLTIPAKAFVVMLVG